MKKDPVCKTKVDDENTENQSSYQDNTYYFCSTDCKKQFEDNPNKYVSKSSQQKK